MFPTTQWLKLKVIKASNLSTVGIWQRTDGFVYGCVSSPSMDHVLSETNGREHIPCLVHYVWYTKHTPYLTMVTTDTKPCTPYYLPAKYVNTIASDQTHLYSMTILDDGQQSTKFYFVLFGNPKYRENLFQDLTYVWHTNLVDLLLCEAFALVLGAANLKT